MHALTLSCPQCGAAASSDAVQCAFCRARLATVACPSCFGLVFLGSRHCAHCGARATRRAAWDGKPRRCPDGHVAMKPVGVGGAELWECEECSGVWVDEPTFDQLCAEREREASALAAAGPRALPGVTRPPAPVRYRPCPDCAKVMNRVNFARVSGIVLDTCKGHGVWFDADELRQIVEFIRAGGLDVARRREREAAAEQQRLERLRQTVVAVHAHQPAPHQQDRPGEPEVASLLVHLVSFFIGS